jgi:16S rRNA (cytosine1402-N4)-methyltransferase
VTLIGADRDPSALAEATARLLKYGKRFRPVQTNFADAVAEAGVDGLAGAILDLGISSHQVDEESRGFTFRTGAPLDMRMEGAAGGESAADLLNALSEDDLGTIFYRYGEERRSRRLARIVAEMRSEAPLQRSEDLWSRSSERFLVRPLRTELASSRLSESPSITRSKLFRPRYRDFVMR